MNTTLFQSASIRLRPFESDDLEWLRSYLNQPDLAGRRGIPWGFSDQIPLSSTQIEAIYKEWGAAKKGFTLAIEDLKTGSLVGHADCDWDWDPHAPNLFLVVDPPRQRQGYGSEALQIVMRYLCEQTPAHNISCWIPQWNYPALAFMQHHHFKEAGRMRRAGIYQACYFDLIIMDILRSEWLHGRG